jgi:hypothetical protein
VEGLTIGGWVAMWRPMEIYLYDWWPLRRRGTLLDGLSRVDVDVQAPAGSGAQAKCEPLNGEHRGG